MRDSDKVWNRAALDGGGGEPRAGDAALAALLLAPGLVSNGGVPHAAQHLSADEMRTAEAGYVFFGFDEVSGLLSRAAAAVARDAHARGADARGADSEAMELGLDAAYARLVPDDRTICARFEAHFADRPELYAPL